MTKIPPNRRKTAYTSLRKIAERLGVPFIVRPPAKPSRQDGDQAELADPKSWSGLVAVTWCRWYLQKRAGRPSGTMT